MTCERCRQHEATVHVSQTRQGKKSEHHLCDACAADLGVGQKIADYFGSVGHWLGSTLMGKPVGNTVFWTAGGIPAFGEESEAALVCPVCQTTFETFRKTGLFGCSHCYETFSSRLDPVFRRVQGSSSHVTDQQGGSDRGLEKDQQEDRQLRALQLELKQAVEQEAYEEAARLRDAIRALTHTEKKPPEGAQ